jgi:hypothetical protein
MGGIPDAAAKSGSCALVERQHDQGRYGDGRGQGQRNEAVEKDKVGARRGLVVVVWAGLGRPGVIRI